MIPEGQDGITHINIYSKGQTELGRMLSNFAALPIEIPEHGKFVSIEGYWYWLGTKKCPERDQLRKVSGWNAKALGREIRSKFPAEPLTEDEFQRLIKTALTIKLETHTHLSNLLKNSSLPFAHYYVFANGFKKDAGFEWILETWNRLRQELQTPTDSEYQDSMETESWDLLESINS